MTRLTDAIDQASGTPAPPAPTRSRGRCLMDLLADPRVRLGAGTAALLATATAARRDHVGPCEAAAFRAVNGLPDSVYPPAWVVMQLGTLGAALAAAGTAWLAGDRELAGRLLASGVSAWTLSKAVKRIVRRPRPASLVPGTHRRGREAAGLGYLSGHAGVAVALGAAALPRLGRADRALTLSAVPVVGLTRIYVGAHLPLDVAGGAALGLVIDAAITLLGDRTARPRGNSPSQRAGLAARHALGRACCVPAPAGRTTSSRSPGVRYPKMPPTARRGHRAAPMSRSQAIGGDERLR